MRFLVVLCLLPCLLHALPDGAPTSACNDLTPRHRTNQPQASQSIYEVKYDELDQDGKVRW